MKNLKDINKFILAEPGSALSLVDGEFPREVRLEINAEETVRLAVRSESKPELLRFLTDVRGRDTVVFTLDEPGEVGWTSDGQVWLWTVELEAAAVISDAESFTKIAERRPRNPDMERVARKMQENADRRMAALVAEVRGTVDGLRAENETLKSKVKEKAKDEPETVVHGKVRGKPAKPTGEVADPPAEKDGDGDAKPVEN